MAKKNEEKQAASPKKSPFTRKWIKEKGIPIVESYNGNLTLRGLHYQLVALGMTNDINHYKQVVAAMTEARWAGDLSFDAFQDHEREKIGFTNWRETNVEDAVDTAIDQIKDWATDYQKNRWENQPIYPEVFIEKKALQGVFEGPCREWNVALNPCKGYPSLTFLNDAAKRFKSAIWNDRTPIILYFGDYDCSGEDIPRSIQENLAKMGVEVEVRRILLMEEHVKMWNLPAAPTKQSDKRSAGWGGIGQVELDAVKPEVIVKYLKAAIKEVFDEDLYSELQEAERVEAKDFRRKLRSEFDSILGDLDDDNQDDE